MRKFNARWWAGPKLSQWRMIQALSMYDPGPFAVHGLGWLWPAGLANPWVDHSLIPVHHVDVQEGGKVRLMQ